MKQLLGKRVLVIPDDPTVTESGILLEHVNPSEKVRPFKGTVYLVGHKIEDVKVGDKIHFNKMIAKDFEHEGVKYLLVQEQDIDGIYGN